MDERDAEDSEESVELFVPGRLCLFGEHSDWAGGHRRQNSKIEKGYAIVAPTNQGNYARVKKIEKPILRFKSVLSEEVFEIELDEKSLLDFAEKGGLFSYVAGVAHEIIASYHPCKNHGIEIDNFKSNLPVKKGLSSSASICVLTAEAFNQIYGLGLTKRRIMELAYFGEVTTPARCGRLDQACAYNSPILMIFDADKIKVEELEVEQDIPLLIVDLKKGKNTVKILADLHIGFPWVRSEEDLIKHNYLGPLNKQVVLKVRETIKEGGIEKVGLLMELAQGLFDTYLQPFSPEELKAPILHQVLSMPEIQAHVYGGKGVGSGGDGTGQLTCKSKEDRKKVKEILEAKGFDCFDLDLKSTVKGKRKMKAVIPAGGFAMRMHPLTLNNPKSLLEIRGKPLLEYTIEKIEEIKEIDEIIIVTNNQFYDKFVEWNKKRKNPKVKILNNGINSADETSSGLGNLFFAIDSENLDEDILVIGGDNVFECSLKEMNEMFQKEKKDLAVFYDVKDRERAKTLGIALIKDNLIVDFEEKPQNPKSTLSSASTYFYRKETLRLIREFYCRHGHGHLGDVLAYLYKQVPVYGYVTDKNWVDINDIQSLKKADSDTYKDL